MVLGRLERDDRLAVGDRQHARLLAVEPLLDHDPIARRAEDSLHSDQVHRLQRLFASVANDHALAGRQAVGLDHDRHVLAFGEEANRAARVGKRLVVGRGHVRLAQQVLAEDLARFQLGGRLGRTEDPQPFLLKGVDDTRRQGCLRPDDRQIDACVLGESRSEPGCHWPQSPRSRRPRPCLRCPGPRIPGPRAGSAPSSKPRRVRAPHYRRSECSLRASVRFAPAHDSRFNCRAAVRAQQARGLRCAGRMLHGSRRTVPWAGCWLDLLVPRFPNARTPAKEWLTPPRARDIKEFEPFGPSHPAVPPLPAPRRAAIPFLCTTAMSDDLAPNSAAQPRRSSPDPRRRGFLRAMFGSWFGLGFTALGAASGLWAAATARFMMPNVLTEPPEPFQGRPSRRLSARLRGNPVQRALRRLGRPRRVSGPAADLRPADRLHAPGLHHPLAGERAEVQVPLPRQRLLRRRDQLRRPRPAAAGTLRDPPGRRRPVGGRQAARLSRKNSASGTTRPVTWPPDPPRSHLFSVWLYANESAIRRLWKSIFRHPAPVDRRNRVVVMLTNLFLHLHPVAIRKHAVRLELHLVHGRDHVLPVPGRDDHRRAADVLLPADARVGLQRHARPARRGLARHPARDSTAGAPTRW